MYLSKDELELFNDNKKEILGMIELLKNQGYITLNDTELLTSRVISRRIYNIICEYISSNDININISMSSIFIIGEKKFEDFGFYNESIIYDTQIMDLAKSQDLLYSELLKYIEKETSNITNINRIFLIILFQFYIILGY